MPGPNDKIGSINDIEDNKEQENNNSGNNNQNGQNDGGSQDSGQNNSGKNEGSQEKEQNINPNPQEKNESKDIKNDDKNPDEKENKNEEIEVEDSFVVDENNKIIEEDNEKEKEKSDKDKNIEAGKKMVNDLAKEARTMTSSVAIAEFENLLVEGFKIPMVNDVKNASKLEKAGIKDEADAILSESSSKEVADFKEKNLPTEFSTEAGLRAINLLKATDQPPTTNIPKFYEKEQKYRNATIKLLNSLGVSNEKIDALKKMSVTEATKALYPLTGSKDVKAAKAYMATKTTDPLKVDEFVRDFLNYGNLDNLTNEQREAYINFSAKKSYNPKDLELAVGVLNGPPLEKHQLYPTIALAKERLEMIQAQMVIDKSSPIVKDLQKGYDKIKEVMVKKGIPGDEFDNLVTNFDIKDESKQENNQKLVDKAMSNLENKRILDTSTDKMLDSFYERVGIAFHAEKFDKGDDLNTTNLRDFLHIMKDLTQYKELVHKSDKSEVDKALVDITFSKFYKFAQIKGIDEEVLKKLVNSTEKELEETKIAEPLTPEKKKEQLENEANSFRKHLSPEEQKIIDDATVEDKGPIDPEPFIKDEKSLEKQAEKQNEAEASNVK